MSQGSYLLIGGCKSTSLRVVGAYIVYILSLFVLFAQFYVASYSKGGKKPKTKKV